MFSVRTTADYEFRVGEAEQHEVRVTKERPVALAAFRPQAITAYVDGQEGAQTEGTLRRGQAIGIGVVIGILIVSGLALQLITQAH